MAKYWSG